MSIGIILLIVIVLVLIGALPTWPHSQAWGWGPSSVVGVALIILVVLVVTGRL